MKTMRMLITVAAATLCFAIAAAQDSTESSEKKKGDPPPEFDPAVEVYAAKTAKKCSVTAVLLTPSDLRKEQLAEIRGYFLTAGMDVIEFQDQLRAWDSADSGKVIRLAEKSLGEKNAKNKLLVIAIGRAGPCGLNIIDENYKRLAGAVLISVSPRTVSPDAINLWAPRGDAWKLPIWVTVGTDVNGAANILLSWRQIAAIAPQESAMTIDTRIDKGAGYISPDDEINKWIASLAEGKKPARGPDRQMDAEYKFYSPFAKSLIAAVDRQAAADPGEVFSKQERPMSVEVAAPKGWVRVERGERAYSDGDSPYVQLYVTPKADGLLFARAMAAEFKGTGRELLADYSKKLSNKGFLVIQYTRGKVGQGYMEINSVLWPTTRKWHRWLVLSYACGADKLSPAAPMLLVMDATEKPDVETMAAAAKSMMNSLRVEWIGGKVAKETPKPEESPEQDTQEEQPEEENQ